MMKKQVRIDPVVEVESASPAPVVEENPVHLTPQHTHSSLRSGASSRDSSSRHAEEVREGIRMDTYYKTLETLQRTVDENAELLKKVRLLESQIVPSVSSKQSDSSLSSSFSYDSLELFEQIFEERKLLRRYQQENEDLRRESAVALQIAHDAKAEAEELKKKLKKNELESQAKLEEDLRASRQQQRTEIHELTTRIQSIERAAGEEKRKLLEERDQYSIKLDILKSGVAEFKMEAKRAREEKARSDDVLERLKLENEVMIRKINQLTAENMQLAEARAQPTASLEKVEALHQEIKMLRSRLKEKMTANTNVPNPGDFIQLLKDKRDIEANMNNLNKKLTQKEARCEQLEREIQLLRDEMGQFKQIENTAHLQMENLHAQIHSLSNELKRAYQSLRELATTNSPFITDTAEHPSTDRSPDDLTQRGKRVAYSDYVQIRRENALLKAQISELRRMQMPLNQAPSTQFNTASPNPKATPQIVRDIEEMSYSLPEIVQSPGTPIHQSSVKSYKRW